MGYDSSMDLAINIKAVDGASSIISGLVNKISGGNGLVKALASVAVAATGAAIGLGVTSVQAASAFQESTDQLVAHAGLAKDQLASVQQSLLNMAPAIGQMPDALAQAIYPVLSGFSGITNASDKAALSLTEMNLAGETVAGTTTNITDVTTAATATFNAFGMQTSNNKTNIAEMNQLFDEMNTTVTLGNQKWSDFSNVAGKLAVSAKAAHISLDEAYASEATLTNEGYSARLATTYLSNTYNELEIKTDSMAKHAKALGVSFNETTFKTMDLGAQISYLNQITGGDQSKLLGIFGGNSVALKTFDALTTGLSSYKSNLAALNQSQGATNTAFGDVKGGFAFELKQAEAALNAIEIDLGTTFLPTVSGVLTWLDSHGLPVLKEFADAFGIVFATAAQSTTNAVQQTQDALKPSWWTEQQLATQKWVASYDPVTGTLKRHSVAVAAAQQQTQHLTAAHQQHGSVVERNLDLLDQSNASYTQTAKVAQQINPFVGILQSVVVEAKNIGAIFVKDVLPPLEKLGGDTLTLIEHFGAWLQSSGLLKQALLDVVGTLSTLVGWVDNFVGWLDKGGPGVAALAIGLTAVGVAIAGIKLAESAAGFYNMFQKLSEGNGIIANLAAKALPNLAQALGWTKTAAKDATTEIEQVAPKTLSASQQAQADIDSLVTSFDTAKTDVALDTTAMETDLEAVGTTAATTAGEEGIGKIGTAMTTEAGTVATESVAMEGSLAAVAGPAGIGLIIAAIPMISQGLHDRFQELENGWKQQIDKMVQDAKDKKSAMEQALTYQANLQIDILRAQYGLPSSAQEASTGSVMTPPTLGKHHATGGYIPPGAHILGDTPYPEMVMRAGSGGLNVFNPAQTAAMMGHSITFAQGAIVIQANGGDPTQIASQLMPAIEREIARRFRIQTNSYTGRGAT